MRRTSAAVSLVVCVAASSAAAQAPSAVATTMAVSVPRCGTEIRRNLLTDEEHGTTRPLEGPRYVIRVDDPRVVVTPIAGGWALRARVATTELDVTAEIREARRGLIVLRQVAALPCAAADEDPLGEILPPRSPSGDDDLDAVPAPPEARGPARSTDHVQVFFNFVLDLLTDWGWLSSSLLAHAVAGQVSLAGGARGLLTNPITMPEVGLRIPVMSGAYLSMLARPAMNIGQFQSFSELTMGLGVRTQGDVRVFAELDAVARCFWNPTALLLDVEAVAGIEGELAHGISIGALVRKSLTDGESISSMGYVAFSV